jgi:hypothetical protein
LNRPTLSERTVVRQNPEPVAVDVDRTVVMMSIQREKYYNLDGVGGRIWELVREPTSIGDLCLQLLSEFDVDPATCRADVEEFLAHLLDEGLVELIHESSDPVRATPGS